MAVDRSDLIKLGTLSRKADHGMLLNGFKSRALAGSAQQCKSSVLEALEIAQIIQLCGLVEPLHKAYVSNMMRLDRDRDRDSAVSQIKRMLAFALSDDKGLVSELDRKFPVDPVEPVVPEVSDVEDDLGFDFTTDQDEGNYEDGMPLIEVEPEAIEPPKETPVAPPQSHFALNGLMNLRG